MHSCALVLIKYLPLIDEQSSLLQSLGYPLCQLHHSCLTSFSPSPLELVSSEALLNCRASIGHNWLVLNTVGGVVLNHYPPHYLSPEGLFVICAPNHRKPISSPPLGIRPAFSLRADFASHLTSD